ncbi:hypothetical protein HDU98_000422 [Podochytrium sp. JEL0797]|nr:hypothetical protein HDU98_000422 [Podochytrium sp. JEL0797]
MDAPSARLLLRTATCTKQIFSAHTSILQTLISLSNLHDQSTATLAVLRSTDALFTRPSDGDTDTLTLLLKSQHTARQRLLTALKGVQMTQFSKCVNALLAVKKDAIALANLDVAKDIASLSDMYDTEFKVLRVLVAELQSEPVESAEEPYQHIHTNALIVRCKTMREVDLVFEARVMDRARNAAEANAAFP